MLGEATLDALGTFLGEAIRCEGVFVALDHLRRAQSTFAVLQLDLPVDHRRGPGLAKRLDQSGNPRMPGDQPGFQLNVDLEIQPIRHSRPPHPAGETYHPARTKAESTTSMKTLANPRSLAGVRGTSSMLDHPAISGMAVRRRSASRKKAPGSWPSTGLSPLRTGPAAGGNWIRTLGRR